MIKCTEALKFTPCYKTALNLPFFHGTNFFKLFYNDSYGKKRTATKSLYYYMSDSKIPWGEWTDWNIFFRVRGYKKGTMHFEFRDEKVWELFNRRVAEIKGWQLPQKTDNKRKGTERTPKPGDVEVYHHSEPTSDPEPVTESIDTIPVQSVPTVQPTSPSQKPEARSQKQTSSFRVLWSSQPA